MGGQSELFLPLEICVYKQAVSIMHSLLLATFTGPVDLKLWKADEALGLFVLNRRNEIRHNKLRSESARKDNAG